MIEVAPVAELSRKENVLASLAREFLARHRGEVVGVVFVGSVLVDDNPGDTDIVVLVRPGCVMTPEDVDNELEFELRRTGQLEGVDLGSHVDTLEVVRLHESTYIDPDRLPLSQESPHGRLLVTERSVHKVTVQLDR